MAWRRRGQERVKMLGITENKATLFSSEDLYIDVDQKPKRKGLGYLDQKINTWLRDGTIQHYLDTKHAVEDHNQMLIYLIKNPIITNTIIRDFNTPNYFKLRKVLEHFRAGKSKIVPIVGQRGSMSAAALWVAEILHKPDRPVYIFKERLKK